MDESVADQSLPGRVGSLEGRDPDFLIIGTMKAGTTSLVRWLSSVEGVDLPRQKEIHFFSGQTWERGLEWYRSLFPLTGTITGEASPGYTHPLRSEVSASRIHDIYPNIRLIFIARHPIERARSHYRHQVQRGREKRSFYDAAHPDSDYVVTSLYSQALSPYLSRFPRSQLLMVPFDDLIDELGAGWDEVLVFLDLPPTPRPRDVHNETASKRKFRGPLLRLWEAGLLPRTASMPRWARNLGKVVLTSNSRRYRTLIESSAGEFPAGSVARLNEDRRRLADLLGRDIWA